MKTAACAFTIAAALCAPAHATPAAPLNPVTEYVLGRCNDLARARGMTPGEKAIFPTMIRELGRVQIDIGIGFPPLDAKQMCEYYSYFLQGKDASIANGTCETLTMNGTINYTICKRGGVLAFYRAWPAAAP
jgi:hypothetical protein